MKREILAGITFIVGVILYWIWFLYEIFRKRKYKIIVRDKQGFYRYEEKKIKR